MEAGDEACLGEALGDLGTQSQPHCSLSPTLSPQEEQETFGRKACGQEGRKPHGVEQIKVEPKQEGPLGAQIGD